MEILTSTSQLSSPLALKANQEEIRGEHVFPQVKQLREAGGGDKVKCLRTCGGSGVRTKEGRREGGKEEGRGKEKPREMSPSREKKVSRPPQFNLPGALKIGEG